MRKKKSNKTESRPDRSISYFPIRFTSIMCGLVIRIRRMKYESRLSCVEISTSLNLPLEMVEEVVYYRMFRDWFTGMSSFAAMQDLRRLGPDRIRWLAECCGMKVTEDQIQLFKDKRIHQMVGKLGDD